VHLAVSGGPDSLAMLLLALEAQLDVTVHHVDHHVRPTSTDEANYLKSVCESLNVAFVLHEVSLEPGENFEARARNARRSVLPPQALTAHTMDDVVETMLLNMLRGAGRLGLSPMINNPTKPLVGVRRSELHEWLATKPFIPVHDESNDDVRFRRNHVRHELLPLMREVAQRDVVPVIFRQGVLMAEEEAWLNEITAQDQSLGISDVDCRELKTWPLARQRRWLRSVLSQNDNPLDTHPPSSDEVDRALAVVRGEVTACELSGGRRLSRTDQRLKLT
jgi:tRNA(Ile)-lysidine synthase